MDESGDGSFEIGGDIEVVEGDKEDADVGTFPGDAGGIDLAEGGFAAAGATAEDANGIIRVYFCYPPVEVGLEVYDLVAGSCVWDTGHVWPGAEFMAGARGDIDLFEAEGLVEEACVDLFLEVGVVAPPVAFTFVGLSKGAIAGFEEIGVEVGVLTPLGVEGGDEVGGQAFDGDGDADCFHAVAHEPAGEEGLDAWEDGDVGGVVEEVVVEEDGLVGEGIVYRLVACECAIEVTIEFAIKIVVGDQVGIVQSEVEEGALEGAEEQETSAFFGGGVDTEGDIGAAGEQFFTRADERAGGGVFQDVGSGFEETFAIGVEGTCPEGLRDTDDEIVAG